MGLLRSAGLILIGCLFASSYSLAEPKILDVDPVIQETPEWCWLAVGEMVLKNHFAYPTVSPVGNYQCGVNGLYWGPATSCWSNCMTCPGPSGTMENFEKMLIYYPTVSAKFLGGPPKHPLRYHRKSGPLDFSDIQSEIDEDRPVVAGINPLSSSRTPGLASHVTLVVGYEEDSAGTEWLIVNDPYPYSGAQSPYEKADSHATELDEGRHRIRYERFVSGLGWTYTGYGIEDPN